MSTYHTVTNTIDGIITQVTECCDPYDLSSTLQRLATEGQRIISVVSYPNAFYMNTGNMSLNMTGACGVGTINLPVPPTSFTVVSEKYFITGNLPDPIKAAANIARDRWMKKAA